MFKSEDRVYIPVSTGFIRRHPDGRVQMGRLRDTRFLVLEDGVAIPFCDSEAGRPPIGFLRRGDEVNMIAVSQRFDEMGAVYLYPVRLSGSEWP